MSWGRPGRQGPTPTSQEHVLLSWSYWLFFVVSAISASSADRLQRPRSPRQPFWPTPAVSLTTCRMFACKVRPRANRFDQRPFYWYTLDCMRSCIGFNHLVLLSLLLRRQQELPYDHYIATSIDWHDRKHKNNNVHSQQVHHESGLNASGMDVLSLWYMAGQRPSRDEQSASPTTQLDL